MSDDTAPNYNLLPQVAHIVLLEVLYHVLKNVKSDSAPTLTTDKRFPHITSNQILLYFNFYYYKCYFIYYFIEFHL